MAQPQRKLNYISPAEYLAFEEKAECKHEFINGRIRRLHDGVTFDGYPPDNEIKAMAGASYRHNIITANVTTWLSVGLGDKPCVTLGGDMRVAILKEDEFAYPDVLILCGKPKFAGKRTDTVTNPVVIIEVLSPSTRNYDRTTKFDLYKTIDSFQDYLLIDQDRVRIDYYHRLPDGRWALTTYHTLDSVITLQSIEVDLPVNRIYQNVPLDDMGVDSAFVDAEPPS